MKNLFATLAILFLVLSCVFSFLPMGTIALIPITLGLLFSYLFFKKSEDSKKGFSKIVLVLTALCLLFVLIKVTFIKNEVEVDTKFEQQKLENKKDAKQDLEEIESDLE